MILIRCCYQLQNTGLTYINLLMEVKYLWYHPMLYVHSSSHDTYCAVAPKPSFLKAKRYRGQLTWMVYFHSIVHSYVYIYMFKSRWIDGCHHHVWYPKVFSFTVFTIFCQKHSFLSPFPSCNQERSSVLGHGVAPLAVVLSQGAPRLGPSLHWYHIWRVAVIKSGLGRVSLG